MSRYSIYTQSPISGDRHYVFSRYDDAMDAYHKFEALTDVYAASLHGRDAAGNWPCLMSFSR